MNSISQYTKITTTDINTLISECNNKLDKTANAASATKLATARTIRTNLASTSTESFDGTANIAPGVTGILPLANGGTGSSTKNFVDLTTAQNIAGYKVFTDGIKAIAVVGKTVDSATLYSTTTGAIRYYWSSTDGGTSNITNLPAHMAFMLISYTYRYISETDYWIEQQLFQAGKPYRRTIRSGTVSGWTSMWIA